MLILAADETSYLVQTMTGKWRIDSAGVAHPEDFAVPSPERIQELLKSSKSPSASDYKWEPLAPTFKFGTWEIAKTTSSSRGEVARISNPGSVFSLDFISMSNGWMDAYMSGTYLNVVYSAEDCGRFKG